MVPLKNLDATDNHFCLDLSGGDFSQAPYLLLLGYFKCWNNENVC